MMTDALREIQEIFTAESRRFFRLLRFSMKHSSDHYIESYQVLTRFANFAIKNSTYTQKRYNIVLRKKFRLVVNFQIILQLISSH